MGVFKPTINLLTSKLNPVLIYTCIGLSKSLFSGGELYMEEFYQQGGIANLMPLIDYDEHEHVYYEACRAVYILSSYEKLLDVLYEGGAIKAMSKLLQNEKHQILLIEGISGLHKFIMKDEYLENIVQTTEPIISKLLKSVEDHIDNVSIRETLAQILERIAKKSDREKKY